MWYHLFGGQVTIAWPVVGSALLSVTGKTVLTWGILLNWINCQFIQTLNYWLGYLGEKIKSWTIKQTLRKTPHLPIPSWQFSCFHYVLHTLSPNCLSKVTGSVAGWVQHKRISFCCSLFLFLHCTMLFTHFPLLSMGHLWAAVPHRCPCPAMGCLQTVVPWRCPCPTVGFLQSCRTTSSLMLRLLPRLPL